MHNSKDNHIKFGIFVVCLVVGFEVHEIDSRVMRIVSVMCKLQHVFSHYSFNYVATTNLIKSICYVKVINVIRSTSPYYENN